MWAEMSGGVRQSLLRRGIILRTLPLRVLNMTPHILNTKIVWGEQAQHLLEDKVFLWYYLLYHTLRQVSNVSTINHFDDDKLMSLLFRPYWVMGLRVDYWRHGVELISHDSYLAFRERYLSTYMGRARVGMMEYHICPALPYCVLFQRKCKMVNFEIKHAGVLIISDEFAFFV